MRKSVFVVLLCCAFYFASFAQSIQGTVVDTSGKLLFSATLSLLAAKDSAVVKFTVPDKKGSYNFSGIKAGQYLVAASSVGFEKSYSSLFTFSGSQDITLPALILRSVNQTLSTIKVAATKPFLEMHLDKMVVNVEASPTNAGANVLEVLAKSPGVTVDATENITLSGKQGVLVMIDGKKTYLGGAELANLLKGIPASNVDQIEIIANPSSRYEAEGNAGIINIKLKKNRNAGFNGSVTAGPAVGIFETGGTTYIKPRFQSSVTLNYKKNKVNLFALLSPNVFTGMNTSIYDKIYYAPDGAINGYTSFLQNNRNNFKHGNVNLGLDWTLNKKNIFGVSFNGFLYSGRFSNNIFTDLYDETKQSVGYFVSNNKNDGNFRRSTSNINWKHSIDTAGQDITFDLDYVNFHNVRESVLQTDYYDDQKPYKSTFVKGDLPINIDIYSFKSDYIKPSKKGRFEAGVKSSIVRNNNDVKYTRLNDKTWENDPSLSNHFLYKENINAVYFNANRKVKKWTIQGGLRMENTNIKGNQITSNSQFERSYTGLFPTMFISNDLNKNNTVKASYSRRINRPFYGNLNPYRYFMDSFSVGRGNPDLKPEYSNRMELAYSYKGKYFVTFNYNVTNDVIRLVVEQRGNERISEFYPGNFDKWKNIAINITTPFKITKWWSVNIMTNLYNNRYYNLSNGNTPPFVVTLSQNINNTYTFAKGYKGELSISYRTREVDQIYDYEPMFNNIVIAIQKQIMKEKGSLNLRVTDPFAWVRFKNSAAFFRMYEESKFWYTSRSIGINFTYRFGKGNNQMRQRTTASQDELNRAN